MKSPCSECPFLKEAGVGCLGKARAEEIVNDLPTDGFVCHKTVDYSLEEGGEDINRKQCGGALIFSEKTDTPNIFLSTWKLFRGEMELKNKDLVVNSKEEFIKKQNYGEV